MAARVPGAPAAPGLALPGWGMPAGAPPPHPAHRRVDARFEALLYYLLL
jgi:hypothetical protein